ncbi:MAG: DUF59 domain-containing protein [Anaerolineaceae bacterium]|nr:DUF59 domain-containing protein [Anaerolineaceae bacterium]
MTSAQEVNRPRWESEDAYPELSVTLREALSEVIDPEIGFNIVQLGLIRNVIISEDKTIINMILTTPFCPYGPAIIDAARQKAEAALERPTEVELGMEMWDFSMMEEGLGSDWGLF